MDGTWVGKCLNRQCLHGVHGPPLAQKPPSPPSSVLCHVSHARPQSHQVFRVTLGLPLPSQLFLLPLDNSYTEVSLVWACVCLLSAVSAESAAACSSPGPESLFRDGHTKVLMFQGCSFLQALL
ncbi:hypothetical protein HJG60_007872 [Phyllostomus discolor]|uniref:Uncharacterized protein n=1 Tax=Phyllostomus discolor TaxID=89673 RepID=A0A834EY89_9CHIR|nr:hypothetical protein HJG60_007872 [Phyllostomus discolor]